MQIPVDAKPSTRDASMDTGRSESFLQAQALLGAIAAATQRLTEPSQIISTTARFLTEHLKVDRCAYAEVEDERCLVITGDFSPNAPSIVGRWPVAAFGDAYARCMLAGEAYVVDDVQAHAEIGTEALQAYGSTATRAVICVPLHKGGRFTAAMAVHQADIRHWAPPEVELVRLVLERCWEALERSRVARALHESEARYRFVVENSPEGVYVAAPDGEVLQMNAAGLSMLAASDEAQVIGRNLYDWVAAEDRDAVRHFNQRICRGETGSCAFGIVRLDGTRRAIDATAVPVPSANGEFRELVVMRDATARVSAELALNESRARLDYAVRLSGIGFWYCDLPFDELMWDDQVKTHFFLPKDARVTIETFYARIHVEDRAATQRAINDSIENHFSYDVVYRTVHPETGALKWIRALGGTAYKPDGSPARFDGVTVDVSAARLDRERLTKALEREREQARLLSEVAAAALTIHRASSIDEVSESVAEQAKRLIGARRATTTLVTDGSQLTEEQALRSARVLAVRLAGRDGTGLGLVELSDKVEGEFDETDRAILTQLTQVAAVAVENASLYDRLREQDRRKDEFLATLAHELRNPLAPVRTGLQVLRLTADAAQAEKTREMMDRQLGHLVRMVDDLLDVSRITLGKLQLKREHVDFAAVLGSSLEATRALIESSGHELEVHLPKAPIPLDVDPTRLSQVFANLLNNAAKYTPPNGRLRLTAELETDTLVVRVTDSGLGIPSHMLPKVFDLFTQVGHPVDRAQGGLGIGLTLVRRLLELHGGSIEAASGGVNAGSTFTVRLPLAHGNAGKNQLASLAPEGTSRSLRVLVVDDNVDGAEMLATFLGLNGHLASVAHDGRQALAAAIDVQPHVVFLDIGLPDMSGYDVARALRAAPLRAQPKLVALTGWGTDEHRRQVEAAEMDHHLVKPVDMGRLLDLLAQVIETLPAAPG